MKITRMLFVVSLLLFFASPALAQHKGQRPHRPGTSGHKPAPHQTTGGEQQAVTTPSGLTYIVTHRANGRRPKTGDTVLVHYTGMLTDGTKFESSYDRNDPIAFSLGRGMVIKGWDEGIAQLSVGDHAILIIPPQLGYGAKGRGGAIPPNATLVFLIALVDIKDTTLSQILSKIIEEKGIEAAVSEYHYLTMREQGLDNIYTNEGDLNGLGYALLKQNKVKEAIEILKLNVEAYPNSANVYDSLGEAYMLGGDRALAIENYQKSLDLDPKNANAAQMLKKLKGE